MITDLALLSQYELTAERSARTRGCLALLYRTGNFDPERVSRFGKKAEKTAGAFDFSFREMA